MSVTTAFQNRWWWGKDSNLRRQCRQIYNLLPLATREPHHGVLLFGFRQKRCQWRQLFKISGGGGRIRTFEGSAGRFTICSLWPLGNPTTGYCLLFGFRQKRCQWRQLLEIDGGGGRIRTFEGSAGRFTICSLWPLGNPTTGYCSLFGFRQKRCQWRQLLKIDGGGGRIRTFEGSAGRFTICSLWPLGNPTTSAGRIIANIPIL